MHIGDFDSKIILDEYYDFLKLYKKDFYFWFDDLQYENQVIKKISNLEKNVYDFDFYWPFSLSKVFPDVVQYQKYIDKIRGIPWEEHYKNLSLKNKINSLRFLNENYNPLYDERLCRNFFPFFEICFPKTYELLLKNFQSFENISRIRFIVLKPKSKIDFHIDNDLSYSIRVHFPLKTNDECYNCHIRDNIVIKEHMKENKIYALNSSIPHNAENNGDDDRIHLLVSIINPNILKNKIDKYKNE